jgi:poly(hydroxyalkanoate) granule-associated protein
LRFGVAGILHQAAARSIPRVQGPRLVAAVYKSTVAELQSAVKAKEMHMVTKLKKTPEEGAAPDEGADLAGTVKESAQQIWLAGLGAFSKAQAEGGKVFQALVKEGISIQRKTQAAAGEKFTDATSRMASMATDLSSKASGQWDKLETIFEERVSRALKKLGVPTAREIDDLTARIEALNRSVAALGGTAVPRKPSARKTAARGETVKRPVAKAARKRAPARKAAAG